MITRAPIFATKRPIPMDTSFAFDQLRLLPVWEASVLLEPTQVRGPGPLGVRNIVPIVGGDFEGVIAPETDNPRRFCGTIQPGGFDLQRERADGMLELEAIYHMMTDDHVSIEIRNYALLEPKLDGSIGYSRCRIFVDAPDGHYAWLNRRIFTGSVEVIRPQKEVLIRSFTVV
ncbi:hypothetical protein B7W85_23580 [Allorhizobium ampelinum]|nr:DUF3237 domain-containing protein [Allorhizobium ampelinum]NSZ45739.1 DUF3237 domain-containing protein [Agrobacterium vitis]NTA29455.1 DUF3237 domain-containing protein [Allorhizobium ampelinum]OVE88449.1 hypothetical protein B7W85_23580 [Allorhizobium ampelinum]